MGCVLNSLRLNTQAKCKVVEVRPESEVNGQVNAHPLELPITDEHNYEFNVNQDHYRAQCYHSQLTPLYLNSAISSRFTYKKIFD